VHVDPAGGANVTWTKDAGGKFIQFACQNSGASALAGAPDLNGCYGPSDMSITKSDSPDPVGPGQNLTYHLTVTNNGVSSGPSTTSGVTVTDPLPAGATLVSATPSTGSCSGTATVSCSLGIFPGGASATIDIVVRLSATASGTLTNTATVSAVTADPNQANNTATATTTIVSGADLSITKTGSPNPVHTGQALTYTLTVRNGGPFAAGSVSVTDQLPRNTAFGTASSTQGSCSLTQPTKRIVTCDLGTIASGATVTATIVVTPPSKKTTITNTASVSSTTSDPNTVNNSASATTSVVP
jgi:uncharacterized repeat protein (TIGR01451 family)